MSILKHVKDIVQGKAKLGQKRSPHWRALEKQILREVNRCRACSSAKKLQVHHVVPFHEDPAKELERSNLVVLCVRCHFDFGHFRNWKDSNPDVGWHALYISDLLRARTRKAQTK